MRAIVLLLLLQMRLATDVREVAAALLELEECLRPVALSAQWQQPISTTDGLLHIAPPPQQDRAGQSAAADHQGAPQNLMRSCCSSLLRRACWRHFGCISNGINPRVLACAAGKIGLAAEAGLSESDDEGGTEARRSAAGGRTDDRVVLPGLVSEPIMIRRRTLLERAAAADQLPRALARRAARQCGPPPSMRKYLSKIPPCF